MISLLQLGVTSLLTYNLYKNLRKRVVLKDRSDLPSGVIDELTLVIPVRNELNNLKVLIPQLVDSRLRPQRLIFLDDQSTDGTSEWINSWITRFDWIQRIQGESLPAGWRGKAWALYQGLKEVKTKSVMFIDADLRLKSPYALGILFDEFKARDQNGFVSVFPRLVGPLSAQLLMDQVMFHLHYFLPHNAESLPTRDAVAGTGQIMMAQTEVLRELNAFSRIRATTHDGLYMARLFSNSGLPVFNFDGQNLFHCEMYADWSSAFNGFSRNALEAYGKNKAVILVMSGLVFWIFVLPFFIWPLMLADPAFLASFLLVILGQLYLAKEFGWGMESVGLAPVKGLSTVGVNLWSVFQELRGAPLVWKGRSLANDSEVV
jgi:glycosyltransferase involved in cell wall biosynthesis